MNIAEAHYHFKLLYNKWDSQHKRDLNPAEIDEILNKAIFIWLEQTYSSFNTKKVGFENTQQRIDDLSFLVIKCPSVLQNPITPRDVIDGIYQFSMDDLNYDYYHVIRAEVNARKNDCNRKIEVRMTQHDDLTKILNDTFTQPSFEWRRVIGVFGREADLFNTSAQVENSSMYIYTNGEFVIDSLSIEYITKPKKVSLGNYNDMNGINKPSVDFDLPDYVILKVIDIAVREAQRILLDPEGLQLYQNLVDNDD